MDVEPQRAGCMPWVSIALHFSGAEQSSPAGTRALFHSASQANKAQLSAAVASQVEATKSGLDMLTRAHQVRMTRMPSPICVPLV